MGKKKSKQKASDSSSTITTKTTTPNSSSTYNIISGLIAIVSVAVVLYVNRIIPIEKTSSSSSEPPPSQQQISDALKTRLKSTLTPDFVYYFKSTECKIPATEDSVELSSVQSVMNNNNTSSLLFESMFIMANGENNGIKVAWKDESEECLISSIFYAASVLNIPSNNGLIIYSQHGIQLKSAEEIRRAGKIIHLLFPMQLWKFPGIAVGYKYHLENNWTLTTLSLKHPVVFRLDGFINETDAAEIVSRGVEKLKPQMGDGIVGTSNSGFLPESDLTLRYAAKGAAVARLPSASYAERLKLVLYKSTQYFSQHVDTFDKNDVYESPEVEPQVLFQYEDYTDWLKFIKSSEDGVSDWLKNDDFPIIRTFCAYGRRIQLFKAYHDVQLLQWMESQMEQQQHSVKKDDDIIKALLLPRNGKTWVLPYIIQAVEVYFNLEKTPYQIPQKPVDGATLYFSWIWKMKQRIARIDLGSLPADIHPFDPNNLYPRYTLVFQTKLVKHVLQHFKASKLQKILGPDIHEWLVQSQSGADVIIYTVQGRREFMSLIQEAYESLFPLLKSETTVTGLKKFRPQRFATIVLYLTPVESGGETVFPFYYGNTTTDSSPSSKKIDVDLTDACSKEHQSLKVKPLHLSAAFFYSQDSDMQVDYWSEHGGCKVHEGSTKWSANIFMWNADALEAGNAYSGQPHRQFKPGDRLYAQIN